MSRDFEPLRLSTQIERRLPPIDAIHASMRKKGIAAWHLYMESHLELLNEQDRPGELEVMRLCCREGFCSFKRYSPPIGGDGIRLPRLENLRQSLESLHMLESLNILSADFDRSFKFNQETNLKMSRRLSIERETYNGLVEEFVSTAPLPEIRENIEPFLGELFERFGFGRTHAIGGIIVYEKELTHFANVIVTMEGIHEFGKAGWSGSFMPKFYVIGPPTFEYCPVVHSSPLRGAIPLRVQDLALGIGNYVRGDLLLSTEDDLMHQMPEIVVLKHFDVWNRDATSRALGHIAAGVTCHLEFFTLVEAAVRDSIEVFYSEVR